jgi:hypothetical protein
MSIASRSGHWYALRCKRMLSYTSQETLVVVSMYPCSAAERFTRNGYNTREEGAKLVFLG